MTLKSKATVFFLFVGDLVALYLALLLALILRYGMGWYQEFLDAHFAPFTIVFASWVLVFYISGLYDLRRLRNNLEFLKTLALTLVANAVIAILLFYLIPSFGIAPKTNLVIFIIIFAIIEVYWRRLWNRFTESGEAPNKVILVGNGQSAAEVVAAVHQSPQFGYSIAARFTEEEAHSSLRTIEALTREGRANLVVVPRELKRNNAFALSLYGLFGQGVSILDFDHFYEIIMRKIPLADVEETWFLEHIENTARFYDPFKRALELLAAIVIGVILSPLEILIALLVKLTSRGPMIYQQARIGKNGRLFTLYKFRSMAALAPDGSAETQGVQWTAQNDRRVTPFGRFIRATHLDELPQLWNIIRGDLSFVGPRPERPEFVTKLKAQIPFYDIRLLVTPGVTGWAQINYPADLTLDDVRQKLQYDIYYLKNRSPILDLTVILKTLKSIFVNPQAAAQPAAPHPLEPSQPTKETK